MAKNRSTKEIERKFLLKCLPPKGILWSTLRAKYTTIYLSTSDPELRVRRRVNLGSISYSLTVKIGESIERQEFIHPIGSQLFSRILAKRHPTVVEKDRYRIKIGNLVWEVDNFLSDRHQGLYIAEVELESRGQKIHIPDWLDVEKEVTNDPRYYNKNLAVHGIPDPR